MGILVFFFSTNLLAASGITYHGRIIKPDGITPVNSVTTQFRIQVRTPGSENCLLWEEQQTKDLSATNGVFSLTINDTGEPSRIANTLPYTIERVFSNRTGFTGLTNCSSGSIYTPSSAAEGRFLQVYFRENPADPWEQMPTTKINFVPLALNSVQLEGYAANEFLKIDPLAIYTPLTAANVDTLEEIIAGTNAQYVTPTTAFVGDVTGNAGATVVEKIRGTNVVATPPTANQVLKFDGTNWVPSADATGAAPGDASYSVKGIVQISTDLATSGLFIAGGTLSLPNVITAGGPIGGAQTVPVITYDSKGRLTAVTTATINDTTKLPLAGGTMTGSIDMGTQNITNATSLASTNVSTRNLLLSDNDTNRITISSPANIAADYSLTLPTTAGTSGYVLSTNGSGALSWINPSTGSVTGVSSANSYITVATGSTTPVITAVVGTTANTLAAGDDSRITGAFQNGGNTVSATATLGTNSAHNLEIETGGTTKMTILNDGNVGIGTTTPSYRFSVEGISSINDRTIAINNTPVIFLPDQALGQFAGSMAMGNGLRSSSHTVGTEGYYNTALGVGALLSNTTGRSNTAAGANALQDNTTGVFNTAVGMFALSNATTGNQNTATGASALQDNTTGLLNTANGYAALAYNSTGLFNTAIGSNALVFNVVKSESTAIGSNSMYYADDSLVSAITYNTAIGAYSLYGSTTAAANTGIQNTALGHSSLRGMSSGNGNIGVGYNSGSAITTGSDNVVIGSNTGSTFATSSNNISIGDGAGTERIRVIASGNVGIGMNNPGAKLEVAGQIKITGGTPGAGKVLQSDATGLASWATLGGSESTSVSNIGTAGVGIFKQLTGSNIELKKINAATSAITITDDTAANELDIGVNAELAGLSGLSANGFIQRTAAGTFSAADVVTQAAYNNDLADVDTCTASEKPSWNTVTDKWDCVAISGFVTSATGFIQGGNSFGAAAVLGTNDAQALQFETSGSPRITVEAGGNVGIGTATPATGARLDVQGGAIAAGSISGVAGNGGQVRFYEIGSPGANYVGFRAPDNITTDKIWELPSADGTAGQVLTWNAGGILTWTTAAGATNIDGLSDAAASGDSVYLGLGAGSSGLRNTGVGVEALDNVTGDHNTSLGYKSMDGSTSGDNNTSIGSLAFELLSGASANNVAVGQAAGRGTGIHVRSQNVLVGSLSGTLLQTGSSNVMLGYNSGNTTTTGSSNILIGTNVVATAATTSNQLNIGNAIYGDLSTGNIGIGAASSGAKLEVAGTIKITGGTPAAGKVLTSDADGDATWETPSVDVSASDYATDVGSATCTTAQTPYWNSVSTQWLCQNIDVTSATAFVRNGGNTTGAAMTIGTNDAFGLDFETGGTAKMTIRADGNVGIGNTNPGEALAVTKASGANVFYQRAPSGFSAIFQESIGGYGSFYAQSSRAGYAANQDGDFLFDFGASGFDGTAFRSGGSIRFQIDGATGATDMPTALVFSTTPDGAGSPLDRMRIKPSGDVGIGTAGPRAKLEVDGAIISKASTLNGTATVDFSLGNIQHTAADCGSFNLWNLKDGGSYTFVVKGTVPAVCAFTGYSGSGSGLLTVKMPPDNGLTTNGKHTIFNLTVAGPDVYVAWTPGY